MRRHRREQLLRIGAGAAGCRQLDIEAAVVTTRGAFTAAYGGVGLAGEQYFFDLGHERFLSVSCVYK
ncbi:hypothetical protein D9M69_639540 [compost metagenome]